MERRGWLATLCLTIRQSEPDFANIRYLFKVNMMFFYLKISNNMNLELNAIKQYKTLSFSTFREVNSKWQTVTHDKALSRKKRHVR